MEITIRPTLKQHEAYEALKAPGKDIIFLGGGAGGGKSWWICESRLLNALRYPGYKSYIGREELKRLMQSTFLTFLKVCKYHNVPEHLWKLNGQYNYIEFLNPTTQKFDGSGSRIDLLDLKFLPTDPLYERFGSLEYTDGAIEEAGEIDFMAFDVLKTRVGRHLNRELGIKPTTCITGNPKDNWTKRTFYTPWIEGRLPENMVFIQSLYKDNPYTADEYGKQLASITDENNRARLKDGDWDYDNDPRIMIKSKNIDDLWTNTVDQSKELFLTGDIARFGSDYSVLLVWQGFLIKRAYMYEKQNIPATVMCAKEIMIEYRIPYSNSIFDEDGVGGGAVDLMQGVVGFVANSSPVVDKINEEMKRESGQKVINYQNLKTQCAFLLADNVNNHKIAFAEDFRLETRIQSMNIEKFKDWLKEELRQVKQKDGDKDGPLKIIPKDEIKESIGRSPDILDNFIMRQWFELKEPMTISYGAVAGGIDPFYDNLGY